MHSNLDPSRFLDVSPEVLAVTMERRHEMGPGGYCICPKCNKKTPHLRDTPCQEQRCPECGAKMLREGSYHHQLSQQKKKEDSDSYKSQTAQIDCTVLEVCDGLGKCGTRGL